MGEPSDEGLAFWPSPAELEDVTFEQLAEQTDHNAGCSTRSSRLRSKSSQRNRHVDEFDEVRGIRLTDGLCRITLLCIGMRDGLPLRAVCKAARRWGRLALKYLPYETGPVLPTKDVMH